MLKRYSFYGVSLELIAVMGFFAALLFVIILAARREAVSSVTPDGLPKGKKRRSR